MLWLTGGRRILLEWFAIAMLATGGVCLGLSANAFQRADYLVYDRLIRLQGSPAPNDIIIIAIDDESIGRLGRFPWSRDVHAGMLRRLASTKPRAILYDILFVDPAAGDERLARAVEASHPIVPLYMEVPGRNGSPVSVVEPLPELLRKGAVVGHANISPDEDGIVRRVYLSEGAAGRSWTHVAAIAACKAVPPACAHLSPSVASGNMRGRPYLIPFTGGPGHFRTVPFSAVLQGEVPDAFFTGRIVLVGATAAGLGDAYGTPMALRDVLMPGVEVNANVVQGLISGRTVVPASLGVRFAFALVPLWLLLTAFLFARPRFNFLLGLGLGLAVVLASGAAFLAGGVWVSPVAAIAGLLVVYPLWAWRRLEATTAYMQAELERFHHDPDVLPDRRRPALEAVQSDIELLGQTIGRARDLRRFVTDALKALPDAALVIDAKDGIIQLMNDRARSVLGDSDGCRFVEIADRIMGVPQAGSRTEIGPDSIPEQFTDAGGRAFDVRWSSIHNYDGRLVSWIVRLADVTELQTANRQREEALQLLTHDMRSPQASIIAALSQAHGDVEPGLAHRIEGYARQTLALADGFVQLARAEAQPLRCEPIALGDALLDAVDDLWPLSSAKRIRIATTGTDDEILVLGDRALLTRAIINLVGNAIKFSPDGSAIACGISVRSTDVLLDICDQGPGLTEEQIATLFQPFRPFGRGQQGAGLGLAFVRSVALRHGGSVSCRKNSDQGCCFKVTLPLAAR